MAQDFAKRKQNTSSKKVAPQKTQARRNSSATPARGNGVKLYFAGVLSGVFLSFLGYLGTLPDPADPAKDAKPQPQAEIPKPRFDFYNILPNQTLDGEEVGPVEPAADIGKPPAAATAPESYLLQAGSFRQKDDAERRRAELLLLGLAPKLEETNGASGQWFRVYLGPFDSHESMTKARGLLANQRIESVPLKRGGP